MGRRHFRVSALPARASRLAAISVTVLGALAMLTACTGRGGGQLPPDAVGGFNGSATFGFDFSCERSSRSTSLNPPAGQLRIELAYTDHGTSPLGSSFSIHGIVDTTDAVLESMFCIGDEPPPGGKLIFLGRYWFVSSAPAGPASTCPARRTETTPLCRFEVIVRDNDGNGAPSESDFFQIKLSSGTALDDNLDPGLVFYTRGGLLSSGNLEVD